ncbi:HNH endonuclease [Paenibacillus sp. N4]|nr:HNH endonuclease [Paenibacillus vietnamensis]
MDEMEQQVTKTCRVCKEQKPLSAFLRRTGKRSGAGARRGTCRECRKTGVITSGQTAEPVRVKRARSLPAPPAPAMVSTARSSSWESLHALLRSPDLAVKEAALLKTTRRGTIWMRGRTDKGRKWHQEIDLELASTLVKERMAVLVNRSTIKRLYSNRDFRRYILERDGYLCYFCGEPGDTIDHMLPRAKGGHTTPDNCVCACNACNQSKADQDIGHFMRIEEADH